MVQCYLVPTIFYGIAPYPGGLFKFEKAVFAYTRGVFLEKRDRHIVSLECSFTLMNMFVCLCFCGLCLVFGYDAKKGVAENIGVTLVDPLLLLLRLSNRLFSG